MNKRKRNIILISLLISVSFLIYYKFSDNKVLYLALGDEYVLGKTPFKNYNFSYSDYFSRYLENNNKLKQFDKSFAHNKYRTTDIINDIKNNKKNSKKEYINQKILKADIITISIGNNELFYKISNNKVTNNTFKYIDSVFNDIKYLVKLIRNINDCPIIFVGYYYKELNEKINDYIYLNYKALENNKNVYYVDLRNKYNELRYFPSNDNNYPTLEGYNYIYNEIIHVINKNSINY